MTNQSLQFLLFKIKKPELTREQNETRVCQEILISKIGNDPILKSKIAFKGGIIIDSLSRGRRGFTKDIDFDFIKYPLSEESINSFFESLNGREPFSNIFISVERLDDLRHKNYVGKRATLRFSDNDSSFFLIVDIGVHIPIIKKNKEINYEVLLGGSTKILANPVERMIAEKLSSTAIFGLDNTRDKDIFDAYFLINSFSFDEHLVSEILEHLLIKREKYYKSFDIAINTMITVLRDHTFVSMLKSSKRNWTNVDALQVIKGIIEFLNSLL